MSFENCYISSACNRTPSAVHWGKNNLICYGSCNSVFIYDPHLGGGKIIKTLHKHTKRVNCVKWIVGVHTENEIVSGSSDETAIVWTYRNNEYIPFILKGHEHIVNIVDGLYRAPKIAIIATGSVDSCVKIWIRSSIDGPFVQIQTLNFGYELCISLRLTFLKCETLLLACGLNDSNIHFFVDDVGDTLKFVESDIIKGHQDWIRGLDFTTDDAGDILLASSSDSLIQLFKITEIGNSKQGKYSIRTRKHIYDVTLESILTGHEGWIYSVDWHPTSLKLLSASIDKMLIVWEYDSTVNLWLETTKLGEIGGNTLGFYGGIFSPDGNSILAHSYHGAFHLWNYNNELNSWDPQVTVGGHYGEVVDLSWEPKGEFLISVSADQTTRIHAPWKQNNQTVTWHEIARPQVHGYDMNCLAILSRYKFASGAEEKVIRAFRAPDNFIQNFRRICHIQDDELIEIGEMPKGASVPSLGLSNKAIYESSNDELIKCKDSKDLYDEESHFTAVELMKPPTEETLIQNTLWPEIQKLYGHGYEVYAMTVNCDGSILASACKATSTEYAAILLWDTSSWKQIQKITSHTLTVVQMAFSPDSKHLLSVSRDRRWSLSTIQADTNKYELVATTDKKTGIHTRIIWCCAWTYDSKYFATGSRDGKVVVWSKNDKKVIEGAIGQYDASDRLELKGESVTALAFAPLQSKYVLAVGFESGFIFIYRWDLTWKILLTFDNSVAHHMAVKRLAFRPVSGKAGCNGDENVLQLASCSCDHSVRIYNIDISEIL